MSAVIDNPGAHCFDLAIEGHEDEIAAAYDRMTLAHNSAEMPATRLR